MWNKRLGPCGRRRIGVWAGMTLALIGLAGCRQAEPIAQQPAAPRAAGQPEKDQRVFGSVDDAVAALMTAVKAGDREEIRRIFGPAVMDEIYSGDPVQDKRHFERFAQHAKEKLQPEKQADGTYFLYVGNRNWPFPIPIARTADGKWFYDAQAGKEEILARRIGADELAAIQACRNFLKAQREYASKDRDGSGVRKYAQHYRSTPGKKDGLYWEAAPGEEQSPAEPMVAAAAQKGYPQERTKGGPRAYQGYYFHILTRQGPAAPGGRYDYVINGNMIAGFALVVSPARYGSSGIMTFMVSHHGTVYEKDLGPDTARIVSKMTEYNPDKTWTAVED